MKSSIFKKAIAAVICGVLVLSLAACGSGVAPQDNTETKSSPAPTKSTEMSETDVKKYIEGDISNKVSSEKKQTNGTVYNVRIGSITNSGSAANIGTEYTVKGTYSLKDSYGKIVDTGYTYTAVYRVYEGKISFYRFK